MDPGELAAMRRGYPEPGLGSDVMAADPVDQFGAWLADAVDIGLVEPNAMVLTTVDAAGVPGARTVLLKAYDRSGFVFFTNYTSAKARAIAANPVVSLLFGWHAMRRQVAVTGTAERIPARNSAEYFRTRPRESQLGAWASRQSSVLDDRGSLEDRYARLAERWPPGTPVPVPDFWGGFRVRPRSVEFWQGRSGRLHDRVRYRRVEAGPETDAAAGATAGPGAGADGGWVIERLAP